MSKSKQPGQQAYETWMLTAFDESWHLAHDRWCDVPWRWQRAWAALEASSTPEPAATDRAALADKWLKHAAAIRADEGVTAAAEALEDCANELLTLNEQAGKAQGWIPVSERLPEDGLMVLFWHQDWPDHAGANVIGLGRFMRDVDGDWWEDISEQDMCGDSTIHYSGVTHWMPLPAPPTKDPTNG